MPKEILNHLQDFLLSPVQTWPYPRLFVDTIVSGLVFSMIVIMGLRLFGVSDHILYGENGILETSQVIALCSASIVAILAAVRLRPAGRFVATTTAMLCLMFFVREIPSCAPQLALGCVPRAAHRIVPAICGSLLLLQAFFTLRASPIALMRMIHPAFSWPLAFVAVLLVTGEMFEELGLVPLEEISELTAYIGLFLSSAWMFKTSFQISIWHEFWEATRTLSQHLRASIARRR